MTGPRDPAPVAPTTATTSPASSAPTTSPASTTSTTSPASTTSTTSTTSPTGRGPAALVVATAVALGVATASVLAVHLALSRTLNVNWDEWSYLSKVHAFARGDALSRLQTFHVHLLRPLLSNTPAPDREVVELLRLRLVSAVLLVVAAGALVQLGRRFLGSVAAGLGSAFAALSFTLVLGHGTAARYDPFVVAAFLVATVAAVAAQDATTTRRAWLLGGAGGAVLALGTAVSVKAALFAPTLAVILALGVVGVADRAQRRRALLAAVVFVGVALGGWRALLVWHGATVTTGATGASIAATTATTATTATATATTATTTTATTATTATSPELGTQLASLGETMLASRAGGSPGRRYFVPTLRTDSAFWDFCLLGAVLAACQGIALLRARRRGARTAGDAAAVVGVWRALACGLPLGALVVYRNTYPYFFVTMVLPASLLVGIVIAFVERTLTPWPRARALAVVAFCVPGAWTTASFVAHNHDDELGGQRAMIAAAHAVFPAPVPYIDRCGMVASYPRIGPFMSSATMGAYRAQPGTLVWPALLDAARPQFLIANIPSLDLRRAHNTGPRGYRWQPADHQLLRESFIPHWGPLWVAGRTLALAPTPRAFPLHIGGRYVVEAAAPVTIDDTTHAPGAVVELAAGTHHAASATAPSLTLRTAAAGPAPEGPPPRRMFVGFGSRDPQRARKAAGDRPVDGNTVDGKTVDGTDDDDEDDKEAP
jgi:hypothetical protein